MIDSRAIIRQYVRKIIANVPPDIGEEAAKALICKQIDTFIRVRIVNLRSAHDELVNRSVTRWRACTVSLACHRVGSSTQTRRSCNLDCPKSQTATSF